jgi:hypothetical protein
MVRFAIRTSGSFRKNAIETQWQENQKLSFNEALNKVQEFGVLVLWMWSKNAKLF